MTPGFRRPVTLNQTLGPLYSLLEGSPSMAGSAVSGIVTSGSVARPMPVKPGRVTPITVNGLPSILTVLPRADGEPSKARRQKP